MKKAGDVMMHPLWAGPVLLIGMMCVIQTMHTVETMLSGWSPRQMMMIIDLYNTQPKRPDGSLFVWR